MNAAPELMTLQEVAEFFRVHPETVYRKPLRYGLKKIKGIGYRAVRTVVYGIAGVPQEPRK